MQAYDISRWICSRGFYFKVTVISMTNRWNVSAAFGMRRQRAKVLFIGIKTWPVRIWLLSAHGRLTDKRVGLMDSAHGNLNSRLQERPSVCKEPAKVWTSRQALNKPIPFKRNARKTIFVKTLLGEHV